MGELREVEAMTTTLRTPDYAICQQGYPMTGDEIEAIWNRMPGGHEGFCKQWGYVQFARKLLETVEKPVSDLQPLKAELRWCLENASGPRTEATLRWAIEVLEEMGQTTEEQR